MCLTIQLEDSVALNTSKMRKYLLIGLGSVNLLHGILHIIQFIQSILLLSAHESSLERFLHNPILSFLWAIIGLVTLYIGIKDFRHHKNCKH
ncbi:hypothetical protein EBQ93_01895 [bacterium]|nr:hypothetical protein [bacterium]